MISLLVSLGLGGAAATLIVRELVPITWKLIRPFSCDLCMSWWSAVFQVLAYGLLIDDSLRGLFLILPSMLLSMVTLKIYRRLRDQIHPTSGKKLRQRLGTAPLSPEAEKRTLEANMEDLEDEQ